MPRAAVLVPLHSLITGSACKPEPPTRRSAMRYLMIPMLLIGGFVALTTTEASAVVYCAVGVVRAGCVVRPAVGAVVAPGAAVVVRRPGVVAPVRRRGY